MRSVRLAVFRAALLCLALPLAAPAGAQIAAGEAVSAEELIQRLMPMPGARLPDTLLDPAAMAAPRRYRPPIDVAARRALWGQQRHAADTHCPGPLEPPPAIDPPAFSADRGGWFRQTRPVQYFLNMVADLTDDYLLVDPAEPVRAQCALRWLAAWADAEAFLKQPRGFQGLAERRWFSLSTALSYLKIRDEPTLDGAARQRVEAWLGRLAARALLTGGELNNHAYWEGLTAMVNGILLNRPELYEIGPARYRLALSQMRADGTLPRELRRGDQSLLYHNFALEPLVYIAEFAARQGQDLFGETVEGRGLKQLLDVVLAGIGDLEQYRRFSDQGQQLCFICGAAMDWAELYYARFADERLVVLLQQRRPLLNPRLGGDITVGYGVKELPAPR